MVQTSLQRSMFEIITIKVVVRMVRLLGASNDLSCKLADFLYWCVPLPNNITPKKGSTMLDVKRPKTLIFSLFPTGASQTCT